MSKPLGQGDELALEGRNGEIWQDYTVRRMSQEAIAAKHGIGQQRVSSIIREVRERIPAPDLDEMRLKSVELYSDMIRRALDIVELTPAPVFVGKDGNIAYDIGEDGTQTVVRDYSGRLAAMRTAADMEKEIRKLYGLDAAEKIEQSGAVRFEIVGVSEDDLS
jgi:hypothetical protein